MKKLSREITEVQYELTETELIQAVRAHLDGNYGEYTQSEQTKIIHVSETNGVKLICSHICKEVGA